MPTLYKTMTRTSTFPYLWDSANLAALFTIYLCALKFFSSQWSNAKILFLAKLFYFFKCLDVFNYFTGTLCDGYYLFIYFGQLEIAHNAVNIKLTNQYLDLYWGIW